MNLISLIIFAAIVLAVLYFSTKRKKATGKEISPIEAGATAVVAWLASEALPWIQGLF